MDVRSEPWIAYMSVYGRTRLPRITSAAATPRANATYPIAVSNGKNGGQRSCELACDGEHRWSGLERETNPSSSVVPHVPPSPPSTSPSQLAVWRGKAIITRKIVQSDLPAITDIPHKRKSAQRMRI